MRIERLESQMMKNISAIISEEIRDTKVGYVTVTDVKVTNDLSFAKVFVTFLTNDNEERNKVGLDALNRTKGFIKSKLAKKIQVRKIPELIFELDTTFNEGNKIENILADIKN